MPQILRAIEYFRGLVECIQRDSGLYLPALKCAKIVGIAVEIILWSNRETKTTAKRAIKTGMS